jgi:hypothetical protein
MRTLSNSGWPTASSTSCSSHPPASTNAGDPPPPGAPPRRSGQPTIRAQCGTPATRPGTLSAGGERTDERCIRRPHRTLGVVKAAAAETAGITVHAHDVLAVVEIASPGTSTVDRKVKTQLYAAAGILHYWRVELEPTPRLIIGELRDGTYADRLPVTAGATARIDRPFPLTFDPADLTRTR